MSIGTSAVWRYIQQRDRMPICDGILLQNGVALVRNGKELLIIKDSIYAPICYNNRPVLSSFRELGASTLPVFTHSWKEYLETEAGSFEYSVYPIIYALTVATVIAIFLTLIVFTNHTSNPSWLLRGGSVLASVNLTILLVRSIVYLNVQHLAGYNSGEKLLDDIQNDGVFNILDFIVVLIALFAQVQVIIRLFSRVREKRVSFILGGTLSICSQVIWGVSNFANFNQEEESDISILPAFTYLLRIALSTMYSGLIVIYAVGKRNFIFHKSIILLTILTFIVINTQVSFFIIDVANVWVSELSEIFNTTVYVSATIIPWEWINRVHTLERHEQREGVLGRPVYEDEYRDIIRYEIIDDTFHEQDEIDNDENRQSPHDDNNDNDPNDHNNTNEPTPHDEGRNTPFNQFRQRLKISLRNTTDALLYFTDQVIEYSLAVPRSVSVNSSSSKTSAQRNTNTNNTIGNIRRKEVFIYSQKEVRIHDDDINDNSTNTPSGSLNLEDTRETGTSSQSGSGDGGPSISRDSQDTQTDNLPQV